MMLASAPRPTRASEVGEDTDSEGVVRTDRGRPTPDDREACEYLDFTGTRS